MRNHTMNDPDPASFIAPTWREAVPKEAWYIQTGGESVAAAHANAATAVRYRDIYLALTNRDFSHEWIKQILQIAFDFELDPMEVADLMRNVRIGEVDSAHPRLKYSSCFDEIAKIKLKYDRPPKVLASVVRNEEGAITDPYVPKEKFKDKLQKQILEARRARSKKENKKRRRG